MLGCFIASSHPIYLKMKYMESVSDAYDLLKAKFKMYPHLEKPDNENIQKNFGLSKWNMEEVDNEDDIELT